MWPRWNAGAIGFSGVRLQAIPFDFASLRPIQLLLDDLLRPIRLSRIHDVPPHRPSRQVRKLQAGRVDLLGRKNDLKRQRFIAVILAVADPPKFQFQFVVFSLTPCLEDDVRRT